MAAVAVAVVLAASTSACLGETPQERQAKAAGKAEDRRKGHHCLSAWDGNHDGLERLVKAQLNDPDSMKTTETLVGPNKDGTHQIRLHFTAKNAFGGRVSAIGVGTFRNDNCVATLERIAE